MNETTHTGSSEQPPGSALRWPVGRVRATVPRVPLGGLVAIVLWWLLPLTLLVTLAAVTLASARHGFDGLDLLSVMVAGIATLASCVAGVYVVLLVRRVRAAGRRHEMVMASATPAEVLDERGRDDLLAAMAWCGRGAAPWVVRFAELEVKYGGVLPRIWVITSPRLGSPGRMVEPGRVIGEPTTCAQGPLRGRFGGLDWLAQRRFVATLVPFSVAFFSSYMALRSLSPSPLDWLAFALILSFAATWTLFLVQWKMQVHADGITLWKERWWEGLVLEKIEVDFSRDVVSLREVGDWDTSVRLLARKRRWHVVVQLPERNMVFATAINSGFALPDAPLWRGITGDVVPEPQPEAGPKRTVVRMDGAG